VLSAYYATDKVSFDGASEGVAIDEEHRVYPALEGGWAQVNSKTITCSWVMDHFMPGILPKRNVTPMISMLHTGEHVLEVNDTIASGIFGGSASSTCLGSALPSGSTDHAMEAACEVWWHRKALWSQADEMLLRVAPRQDQSPPHAAALADEQAVCNRCTSCACACACASASASASACVCVCGCVCGCGCGCGHELHRTWPALYLVCMCTVSPL
jgi:hypothetical protein